MTATGTLVAHDWRLVAPWWHWPKAGSGDAAAVRTSAPVLQKYDSPDLVNAFLADPQHRLAFLPSTDEVATVSFPGGFPQRVTTGRRKLFLGSHHRHYLVVASLHCDAPGFPRVDRTAACEAGFVVRRRTVSIAAEDRQAAAAALRQLAAARRRRQGAAAQLAAARQAGRAGAFRLTALEGRLRSLENLESDAAGAVKAWADQAGTARQLEGWVPHGVTGGQVVPLPACPPPAGTGERPPAPLAGVGAWRPVPELPEEVEESTFPLYPLVADPSDPGHDATGETIWFGVVPTGSADVDLDGGARFDDRRVYEIRCFVRRHRPECPADGSHCRCPVTWSEPGEPYQLASHFDLEGTANRPVTVQLPDLDQLRADAFRLGPGGTGGVRFQSPPGSALGFSADGVEATDTGPNADVQICSFSIPLITIVAMFVFKLFLPIVVFVFQLWFLLMLKFCIPPDVSVGGGLDAAFDAMGGGLEIDATIAASLTVPPLSTQLDGAMDAALGGFTDPASGKSLAQRIRDAVAGGALDVRSYAAIARGALAQGPVPPPDRVVADRVERSEVVVP